MKDTKRIISKRKISDKLDSIDIKNICSPKDTCSEEVKQAGKGRSLSKYRETSEGEMRERYQGLISFAQDIGRL